MLTFDVPLLKLSGADTANMLFLRGMMLAAALWLWWFFAMRPKGKPFFQGRTSLIAGLMSCAQNLCFITSLQYTSVSNVVFILAFNPMFAAILSAIFLGERIRPQTIATILAALVGVVIIVWDGIGGGSWLGDLLALACALLLAMTLTYTRHSGKDLSLNPAVGMGLSALVAAPFAVPSAMTAGGLGWLAMNGFFVAPLSFALLSLGPRYISAAEVAMFFLLETCITPVWMWVVFGEIPPEASLVGGAIIITALVLHSAWQLYEARRKTA